MTESVRRRLVQLSRGAVSCIHCRQPVTDAGCPLGCIGPGTARGTTRRYRPTIDPDGPPHFTDLEIPTA